MNNIIKALYQQLDTYLGFASSPLSAVDRERRLKQALDICKALESAIKAELE